MFFFRSLIQIFQQAFVTFSYGSPLLGIWGGRDRRSLHELLSLIMLVGMNASIGYFHYITLYLICLIFKYPFKCISLYAEKIMNIPSLIFTAVTINWTALSQSQGSNFFSLLRAFITERLVYSVNHCKLQESEKLLKYKSYNYKKKICR